MANILIIGGGVAGLSTGIYAAMEGHCVSVCERHRIAGGNLTAWEREGYHIDNCIHWLTGTNPVTETYRMWESLGVLGEGIEVIRNESLYTCERNGERLTLWRDLDRVEQEMTALSPVDETTIRSFFKTVRVLQWMSGIGGASHSERLTPSRLLKSLPGTLHHYHMTAGELAREFHHPLLGEFIMGAVGEPFASLAAALVIASFCGENADLPRGGSSAMAARLGERLRTLGGTLLLSKEAVAAETDGGCVKAVRFSDGTRMTADYVVLAGDPAALYPTLLGHPLPSALQKIYQKGEGRRFSSWHCAIACDVPELPFSGDLIFSVSESYRTMLGSTRLILREYAHEESWMPKGKRLLQCMVTCDEAAARAFLQLSADREAYRAKKEALADTVMQILSRKFPMLYGKLHVLDVWTPATYRRYTASEIGSWMSFILPPSRVPRKVCNTDPRYRNLIFATQWLHAPGGLPLAASEGKRAAQTLSRLCLRDAARQGRKHFRPAHA